MNILSITFNADEALRLLDGVKVDIRQTSVPHGKLTCDAVFN